MRGPHFHSGHVAEAALLDFIEQRLSPQDRRDIDDHLAGCLACRSAAGRLALLLDDLAGMRMDRPPAHLSAWARSIPGLLAPRQRPGWLELVADSWGELIRTVETALEPLQPTPMLRGVDIPHRAGRRRLLFAAGRFDLDLEIAYPGQADPRQIRGQLLPAEDPRQLWTESKVRLMRGRSVVATARMDARGGFVLPKVAAGRYALSLAGPVPARTPAFEV